MILHIVNQPISKTPFNELKQLITQDDTLFLTADACYDYRRYQQLNFKQLFLLEQDARARLTEQELSTTNTLNFSRWVELTLSHQQTISW